MNNNSIRMDGFSNDDSERLYRHRWPDEPQLETQCEDGWQCGGCSFFAPFNGDWGLCCNGNSRHHLETVFEHFTCPALAREGWGAHSFSENERDFCRCDGYTPLPAQTELICLQVKTDKMDGQKSRVTLAVNERFSAEESSLYFALDSVQKQIEAAIAEIT